MIDPIDPWPGELRTVGRRRLHVRAGGDGGSRVVYLHGLGGSSTDWTDLMGALADDHRGEAPDLPGFGLSPPPDDGDYSVDAHADAAVGVIRSGPCPVHLVGNSLGGSVAVRLAAERPELVRTLTLISPALPDLRPRLVPYQMVGALFPVLGPAVYTRIQSRPAEVRVQDMLDATYYDPASVPAQRVMEALEAERERERCGHAVESVLGSLRGLVAEYLRRGPRSLWRQAAGLQVPSLLVYAVADRFIDPRTARRAARVFPRNRLVVMNETGHVAMMERPEAVAREVRPFLAGADASRTRPA